MKHKIVLEIDGIRYKLIETRSVRPCEKCSLNTFKSGICTCGNIIHAPCIGRHTRFRKCKLGE